MSKKWKGKTCAYCGVPGSSQSKEHVLARAFVLDRHRGHLPAVPACKSCNAKKSALETYLATYLLAAGRHEHAAEMLQTHGPGRLRSNPRAREDFERAISKTWFPSRYSLFKPCEPTMLVDAEHLTEWLSSVCAGLIAHHWKIIVAGKVDFDVEPIALESEHLLEHVFASRASHRVGPVTIGGGALSYQGAMDRSNEFFSAWRFMIYGGMVLAGDDPNARTRTFYVTAWPHGTRPDAVEREIRP